MSYYVDTYGQDTVDLVARWIDFISIADISRKCDISTTTVFMIAHVIYQERGYERLTVTQLIEHFKEQIHDRSAHMTCHQIAEKLAIDNLTTRINGRDIAGYFGSLNTKKDSAKTKSEIQEINQRRKDRVIELAKRKEAESERLKHLIENMERQAKQEASKKAAQIEEEIRRKAMAILARQKQEEQDHEVLLSRIAADLRACRLSFDDAKHKYGKEIAEDALDQVGELERISMLKDINKPIQLRFIRENWELSDKRIAFFLTTSSRQVREARKRIQASSLAHSQKAHSQK